MRAGEEGGGCFPTGRHYPGIAHLLRIVAQGLVDGIDGATSINDVPLIAIDTETTGRDFAVDRIVEIAAVVWLGGEVVARQRWLVNPSTSTGSTTRP
jgi:DNA polymerase-3 subunit epsilon